MPNARADSRFAHIDALRAIAALLVVCVHTSEGFTHVTSSALWVYDATNLIDLGRIGVVVFFLISGFVIPSSLERPMPKLRLAGDFVIRRFFRLFPVFWLSIPLAVLTFYAIWDKPQLDWVTVLANFTMIPGFLGFAFVEGVYWTLQTELVFYAVCIILLLTTGIRPTWVIATLAVILLALFLFPYLKAGKIVLGGVFGNETIHVLLGHLSLMFTGTLLRRWHDRTLGRGGIITTAALSLFWLAVPSGLVAALPFPWAYLTPLIEPAYAIAMAIFLLGAFVVPIRLGWVAAIGRASYSLYLFHPIVFWPLVWIAELPPLWWLRGYPLFVYLALATVPTLLAALWLYRHVELPMMALGSRIARGRAREPVVEAA